MSYRVFGSAGSPYSIKVRSYFRYKDIDHVWLVRNTPELHAEHMKHSKLPLVPTVAVPDGPAIQDSTPIIEAMELKFPEPSIHPKDEALKFLSALVEEFADEWGNKWMMHFRWYSSRSGPDSEIYSRRIACELNSGKPVGTPDLEETISSMADMFKGRMLGRGFTVGSNEQTAPIIENSLSSTLEPFLKSQMSMFLRWSDANAKAVTANQKEMSVVLGTGKVWKQVVGGPQKYHVKSLKEIRSKYTAVASNMELAAILKRCDCLELLQEGVVAKL